MSDFINPNVIKILWNTSKPYNRYPQYIQLSVWCISIQVVIIKYRGTINAKCNILAPNENAQEPTLYKVQNEFWFQSIIHESCLLVVQLSKLFADLRFHPGNTSKFFRNLYHISCSFEQALFNKIWSYKIQDLKVCLSYLWQKQYVE